MRVRVRAQVIQKLAKQRKDSIDSYRAGGREDLVAKEQAELGLLETYLPQQASTRGMGGWGGNHTTP